jgi:hypothetical protein
MKTSSKILIALAATAAFSNGPDPLASMATSRELSVAVPLIPNRTSRLEYHDLWRKLWEDHITWTRIVILAILDDLAGAPAYTDRLLQNPQDMADALRPFYGEDADQLGELIREHLVIAAQILQAIHDGQPTEDLIARWYANADEIAAKMAEMNPQFWPFTEAQRMWREHLDATVAEILAHHNGNYAAEVAAYDLVHNLALEMADFFSNGVMRQFPRNFKGHIQ